MTREESQSRSKTPESISGTAWLQWISPSSSFRTEMHSSWMRSSQYSLGIAASETTKTLPCSVKELSERDTVQHRPSFSANDSHAQNSVRLAYSWTRVVLHLPLSGIRDTNRSNSTTSSSLREKRAASNMVIKPNCRVQRMRFLTAHKDDHGNHKRNVHAPIPGPRSATKRGSVIT